jgi:HSP20 family protein
VRLLSGTLQQTRRNTGEKHVVPIQVQGKFIRQERPWGNWSRKLKLAKEVDSATIAAEFDNGMLTVRVPKVAKAEPLRIAIGAGASKAIEA